MAALRLALAVCNCWGFHYPLTEEEVPELLQTWLMEGAETAPTIHDAAPADEAALLVEQRQVYALGARLRCLLPVFAACQHAHVCDAVGVRSAARDSFCGSLRQLAIAHRCSCDVPDLLPLPQPPTAAAMPCCGKHLCTRLLTHPCSLKS